MIYLTTGANGAGKTLFTLKDCVALANESGRPVAYNGRFKRKAGGPLDNWKLIDFKDWQNEPDGTIFFIDECHNDLPKRPPSAPVPAHVGMLAEHRRRGFDFFLITQHPLNIDSFVRRLIGSPGWHRHLKRTFGASLVSSLQWASVNERCEKAGSGESGEVKMLPFPKEVYGWYESAELHTGKTRIPRAVYVVAASVLLVPTLAYFAYRSFTGQEARRAASVAALSAKSDKGDKSPGARHAGAVQGESGRGAGGSAAGPLSQADYLALRNPRIEGLPNTAPAYDSITAPKDAPYPAACIDRPKADACTCYTQQGTKLTTPKDLCRQIVHNGYFLEWHLAASGGVPRDASVAQPVQSVPSPGLVPASASPLPAALPPAAAPAPTPAPVLYRAVSQKGAPK